VFIDTREGVLLALPGRDYIIKCVDGELYPIRKDIFERTYQKIISTVVE
jgi:sulfur transfer complex TusBCD TusB component (DsrH family)